MGATPLKTYSAICLVPLGVDSNSILTNEGGILGIHPPLLLEVLSKRRGRSGVVRAYFKKCGRPRMELYVLLNNPSNAVWIKYITEL